VLFVVAATNAFNLIDGLDGLAAGLSLIIGTTLILLAWGSRDAVVLVALCGALIGFLPYNRHPARIFLGDSGALLLGFMIGVGAVSAAHQLSGADALLAPAVALGLPLLELLLTAGRRISCGKPLFTADRDHIHHRLLAIGIDQRNAVLILYAVGAGFCVIALMLPHLNDSVKFALLVTVTAYSLIGARMLGYHRELRPLRASLAPALTPIEGGEPARLQIHTLEP
jgi:UDP-GlcNAc:undecaprenyl-phosphate GlcNAc-1-phosphate transferase